MNKHRDLTIVGLTAVALTFGLPVLDGLSTLVCNGIGKIISSWQLDTDIESARVQDYVNKLVSDDVKPTSVIGFSTDSNKQIELSKEETE